MDNDDDGDKSTMSQWTIKLRENSTKAKLNGIILSMIKQMATE